MGMGEPLYNSDHVAEALNVMSDGDGLACQNGASPYRPRAWYRKLPLWGETGVMLAISLHAVTDALRDELVPLNKKYPIAELLDACRNWPGLSNAKRITFEYVMLKGVNDSDADARALVKLLAGIPAKINLIPFNPGPARPINAPITNACKLLPISSIKRAMRARCAVRAGAILWRRAASLNRPVSNNRRRKRKSRIGATQSGPRLKNVRGQNNIDNRATINPNNNYGQFTTHGHNKRPSVPIAPKGGNCLSDNSYACLLRFSKRVG